MYVIYKENNIPTVGGVHPKGIETGLGMYGEWNLADCPTDKMHEYKEFGFISVPLEVAKGIMVADFQMDDDMQLEEVSEVFTLSEQDEKNLEASKKYINNIELKLITRAKVREIKDVEDDLVDLKRMAQSLITFINDDWKNATTNQKNSSKYSDLMNKLSQTIPSNVVVLSSLTKDMSKLESIVDSEIEIAEIVDNYYLSKKL